MSGFDVARFEVERAARHATLGIPVVWQGSTASTNDDALLAAKSGAPHGALFGAETQLRGRGRRGSEWSSAPGAGLWFSLVLRPDLSADATPGLALCAGLSVREAAAARVGDDVRVKWPNDVLVGRRKLAGVLVESQVGGARVASVVVGIGINVAQTEFSGSLAEVATSLTVLDSPDRDRERLLADVLLGLEARLRVLQTQGLPGIADELRRYDALSGLRLSVDDRHGEGAGIDHQGRLLLKLADGRVEAQLSGHVVIHD